VLAGWVATLAVAGVSALGLAGQLSGGGWYASGSQSAREAAAMDDGVVGRGESTLALVVRDERSASDDVALRASGEDRRR
jgi:RND superfamily putative drug exporter